MLISVFETIGQTARPYDEKRDVRFWGWTLFKEYTIFNKKVYLADTLYFPDGTYMSTASVPPSGSTWLDPVKSFKSFVACTPGDSGIRYIASLSGGGWAKNTIYECNGTSWNDSVPVAGNAVVVIDSGKVFLFNGTNWVSSTISSGSYWAPNSTSILNTNAGSVLIGTSTTTSGYKLKVQGNTYTTGTDLATNQYGQVHLANGASVFGSYATAFMKIIAGYTTGNTSYMSFLTNNGSTYAERYRITSSGRHLFRNVPTVTGQTSYAVFKGDSLCQQTIVPPTNMTLDTLFFPDGTYFNSADGRGVINVNATNYQMQDIDRIVSDSAVVDNDTIILPLNPTPGWLRTVIQTNGGLYYSIIDGNGKRIHMNWQYYKVSSTNPTTLVYNSQRDKYEFISERIDAMGVDTTTLPTDDLVLHWCADSLTLTDGDPVTLWNDLSGEGNDATCQTAASQPLFKESQISGHPAIYFDGTNDSLNILNSTLYDGAGYSTLVVLKRFDDNSAMALFSNASTGFDGNVFMGVSGQPNYYFHHNDRVNYSAYNANGIDLSNYSILAFIVRSDSLFLYLNNDLVSSGVYINNPPGTYLLTSIGQFYDFGVATSPIHGYVAEVLHYFTNNKAYIIRAGNYLSRKYNIY